MTEAPGPLLPRASAANATIADRGDVPGGRARGWIARYGAAEAAGTGVVAGTLAADVTFYVPVIISYEIRKRLRRGAA